MDYFAIKERFLSKVLKVTNANNDRIMAVRAETRTQKITIIVVYRPHENNKIDKCTKFYNYLSIEIGKTWNLNS